jgi:phosphonate transport system substrate-binding protein
MRRIGGVIVVLSLVLVFAGARPAGAQDPAVLRFCLSPSEEEQEFQRAFQGLMETITRETGKPVKYTGTSDFTAMIEAMRARKLEIGYFGALGYVLARDVAKADVIASPVFASGTSKYTSVVVTRVDTGIKSLADLKGKTFAFVDPASTSGYLYPSYMLTKAGIDPAKDLKHTIFAGGTTAAYLALKAGKVDAAATADIAYNKMVETNAIDPKQIVIIQRSEPIPGPAIAIHADLSPALKAAIRKAFLSYDPKIEKTRVKGWGDLKGYEPTADSDYDGVRELAKILKVDLKKQH